LHQNGCLHGRSPQGQVAVVAYATPPRSARLSPLEGPKERCGA